MLNCQRIHFMSSKKLRYCATSMTDMTLKRLEEYFYLEHFFSFFFLGGGIFETLSKPLLLRLSSVKLELNG